MRSNADLLLQNGSGGTVARSVKGGNKAEKVQQQLAAGTYYVQVKGRGGATGYKLKGSATPVGSGGTAPAPGTGTRNKSQLLSFSLFSSSAWECLL